MRLYSSLVLLAVATATVLSAHAAITVTNPQVFVLGSSWAGHHLNVDSDDLFYTTPASGTQNWTPSIYSSNDGYYASASASVQSVVGTTNFSLATTGSGISWTPSGRSYIHLTTRFSMNFTVSAPMQANFLLKATINGNIPRYASLILIEDSNYVVSLIRSSNGGAFPDLLDDHLLVPGKSYYFSVTFTGEEYGSPFYSLSATMTALGSMNVQPVSAATLFNQSATSSGLTGNNALPNAMPFGDGVPNLIKYAFNMNLAGPDASVLTPATGTGGLPTTEVQGSGSAGIHRMEFLRRVGSGLVYSPQKTSNLADPGSWTALSDSPTVVPVNATWERVIYEEPLDFVASPKSFLRVQVVIPN